MDYLEIIAKRKENMKKKFRLAIQLGELQEKQTKLIAELRQLREEGKELDDQLYSQMREEVGVTSKPLHTAARISDDEEGERG